MTLPYSPGLYLIDFLQHDAAGMEREAARLMGEPGYEDIMLDYESNTAACAGRLVKGARADAACSRLSPARR